MIEPNGVAKVVSMRIEITHLTPQQVIVLTSACYLVRKGERVALDIPPDQSEDWWMVEAYYFFLFGPVRVPMMTRMTREQIAFGNGATFQIVEIEDDDDSPL